MMAHYWHPWGGSSSLSLEVGGWAYGSHPVCSPVRSATHDRRALAASAGFQAAHASTDRNHSCIKAWRGSGEATEGSRTGSPSRRPDNRNASRWVCASVEMVGCSRDSDWEACKSARVKPGLLEAAANVAPWMLAFPVCHRHRSPDHRRRRDFSSRPPL